MMASFVLYLFRIWVILCLTFTLGSFNPLLPLKSSHKPLSPHLFIPPTNLPLITLKPPKKIDSLLKQTDDAITKLTSLMSLFLSNLTVVLSSSKIVTSTVTTSTPSPVVTASLLSNLDTQSANSSRVYIESIPSLSYDSDYYSNYSSYIDTLLAGINASISQLSLATSSTNITAINQILYGSLVSNASQLYRLQPKRVGNTTEPLGWFFDGLIGSIETIFTNIFDSFVNSLKTIFTDLITFALDLLKDQITIIVSLIFDAIKLLFPAFEALADLLVSLLESLFSLLIQLLTLLNAKYYLVESLFVFGSLFYVYRNLQLSSFISIAFFFVTGFTRS